MLTGVYYEALVLFSCVLDRRPALLLYVLCIPADGTYLKLSVLTYVMLKFSMLIAVCQALVCVCVCVFFLHMPGTLY